MGRFLSVDPLFKDYPWYTPYQFAGNKPVWAIDLDGLEEVGYLEAMGRSIAGKPLIQKQSEWLQKDRYTASGTFAKAASFNTSKGNSGVYKPVNQIHNYYQWGDAELHKRKIDIRWFDAALEVTSPVFGIGASQYGLGQFGGGFSKDASAFLSAGNAFLFEKNLDMMKGILETGSFNGLTGKDADYAMVEAEQTALTGFMNDYQKKVGAKKFGAIMNNLNDALNDPVIDSPFTKYIDNAKSKIGGNVDMRNQKHREVLGKSLVDEVRK